jgi:hypothetical protein
MRTTSFLAAMLLAAALQGAPAARAREAFLADTADAAALRRLLAFPELLEDRQVRQKILRSFSSSDPTIFTAALEVALKTPRLAGDTTVARRLDDAISGPDARKKITLLDLAVGQGYLADAHVVTVIAEALSGGDVALRARALQIVRDHAALLRQPAIAEALDRRPEGAGLERPAVKLPDFRSFMQTVQPILEAPGADDKACFECHKNHAVLRLPEMEAGRPAEDQIRERYRAVLRVIDLDDPERSLLLRKPTSPHLAQGSSAEGALVHGGDVRFEKGSPQYNAILDWIKTGR